MPYSEPMAVLQKHTPATRLGLVLAVVIGVCEASATVYEFGNDGKVIVTEASPKPQATATVAPAVKATSTSVTKEALRAMTRDVALNFSGAAGVRKAGIDALTFIEVFEVLIHTESRFNPKAVSPKGAQGLGQLMPDTASDMKVADPFDPKQNLIGSATYFTQLLGRFGSLDLALAAYNAGPENVKKYDGIPPFKETRDYVTGIMKAVGLPDLPTTASPTTTAQAASPKQDGVEAAKTASNSSDQPLTGETSVWEF